MNAWPDGTPRSQGNAFCAPPPATTPTRFKNGTSTEGKAHTPAENNPMRRYVINHNKTRT